MSKVRDVKVMWESYYNHVLKAAGVKEVSVQYRETRRAFYAGANALLGAVILLSGEEDEDSSVAVLQSLSDELADFANNMMGGRT